MGRVSSFSLSGFTIHYLAHELYQVHEEGKDDNGNDQWTTTLTVRLRAWMFL